MPKGTANVWTDATDTLLRRMRAAGADWCAISAAFALPIPTCMDRARAIGARRPSMEAAVAQAMDRSDERRPLPPGDPLTWGAMNAGTVLEGATYAYA